MMPLMMLPTTRPRACSDVRNDAVGTSIWTTVEVAPTAKLSARNGAALGARAAPACEATHSANVIRVSRRFSTTSISGTTRNNPMA